MKKPILSTARYAHLAAASLADAVNTIGRRRKA